MISQIRGRLVYKSPEEIIIDVHGLGYGILIGLFVVAKLINWQPIYGTFGFQEKIGYIGLFLVPVLLSPLGYFVRPIGSAISRRYERQAV